MRFLHVITVSKISSQNNNLYIANDLDKQIMQNKNDGRAISYIQHIALHNVAIILWYEIQNAPQSAVLSGLGCACAVCG